MRSIYNCLQNIQNKDGELFGMKTIRLAGLLQKGYDVPAGYALSVEAFTKFCSFNGITTTNNSMESSEKILAGSFPDDLRTDLNAVWNQIAQNGKCDAIIVRSSAIDEDEKQYSCAGIYESIINIKDVESFFESIKKCWASYFCERALVYRKKCDLEAVGMGLIIQEMISGEKAGVIFTINPVTGNRNEMVIEAYPGLNFAVVEGITQADKFIVDRQGNILSSDISDKKVEYCIGGHSLSIDVKSIEKVDWAAPCLSVEELFAVSKIGTLLEEWLGEPCDVEWTIKDHKLFILQCRPVTVKEDSASKPCIPYNFDIPENVECSLLDRYSEPASTCYLSLLESWEEVVYLSFYTKLEGKSCKEKPFLFYFNRVYWNHKFQREVFDNLPFDTPICKDVSKKLKLTRLMFCGYKKWYKRLDRYEGYIKEFSSYDTAAMNIGDLIRLAKKVTNVFCNYIGKDHFRFLGLAQVCYKLLTAYLPDTPEVKENIARIIESNDSKNMTMQSNDELLQLAMKANSCTDIREIFCKTDANEIYETMKGTCEREKFRKQFDDFIKRHGHRGTSCDDLYTPHWVEEPAIVLELMKQLIINPVNSVCNSKISDAAKKIEQSLFIDRVLASSNKSILSKIIEKKKLNTIIQLTTEYMTLRENQRYYFDKSWVLLRGILLSIGNILVEKGILQVSADIFHLTIDEIYDLEDRNDPPYTKDWESDVEQRKKAYLQNIKIAPPYLIKDSDLIRLQKSGLKKNYKSTGISPGKALGPVRTISSIADLSKVRSGDIAVVSTFHPSWTPMLGVVSGLVMNYGNILSHGAVVAREYRIPVVVFNDMATHVLQDGLWIEINGTTGRIRVCDIDDGSNKGEKNIL
ncbi:PEP/pyruvate-binding domain-containing protein [Pelosinus baikalensis]|uniref:Phosphoenolpyruvate synthase n=1 Tax=Pelosinus baikalensis TaxID=2892015 RepID=A0ABS8HWJ8_9FIRM|nr:PEP/pyruvate-binding domain-containing protein [Pelosinus baikalensis]MCC5466517.1 hypothetical protein [Pelosinus baikalensis]